MERYGARVDFFFKKEYNLIMNHRYLSIISFLFLSFFLISTKSVTASQVEALGFGYIGIGNTATNAVSPAFVSFNCENWNPGASCTHEYNVTLNLDDVTGEGYFSGSAWIGWVENTGYLATGSILFSNDTIDYLTTNSSGVTETLPLFVSADNKGALYNSSSEVEGWARIMSLAYYGWDTHGSNEWGWIKLRGNIGGTSSEYGVNFDQDQYTGQLALGYENDTYGRFSGWGWMGSGAGSLGWVKFDLGSTTGSLPWLQTLYGDVYSRDGYSMPIAPPASEYNATYLILSNGAIDPADNFDTQLGSGEIPSYGSLNVPSDSTTSPTYVYRSNVGKIDINKLLDGNEEFIISASDIDTYLSGKVYYYENTATLDINTDLSFMNGVSDLSTCPADNSCLGNGTVIVNGDLNINSNINYFSSTSAGGNLYNLASIAWIVMGNMTVSPSVSQLAGTFIVLGNDGISTGNSDLQLTVNGLMMARKFNFERKYSSYAAQTEPAEKIIYDGRAFLNTPPGLEDLIATLPELRIGE